MHAIRKSNNPGVSDGKDSIHKKALMICIILKGVYTIFTVSAKGECTSNKGKPERTDFGEIWYASNRLCQL